MDTAMTVNGMAYSVIKLLGTDRAAIPGILGLCKPV